MNRRMNSLGALLALAAVVAITGLGGPRIMAVAQSAGAPATPPINTAGPGEAMPQKSAYHHAYHQCLVYKITCEDMSSPNREIVSFEEVLRMIRVLHDLTGGLKQIVYLHNWQLGGHASYPAWPEVNPRLKRPADPDARASFLWLAAEARKLNAFVSVHLNMSDAYKTSPLWKEYLAHDLIVRDKKGAPVKGAVWDGDVSYQVDKVREWKSGYTRKRIDALLAQLPFLRDSATVHIDAFGMIGRNEKLRTAVFGILDYWRAQGVDVTTEYFDPAQAGRVPWVWHLNLAEENRLKYPPNVVCGGGDYGNMRDPANRIPYANWALLPEAGCLYEEAWGISLDRSIIRPGVMKGIVGKLCTRTLIWYFLNRHRALSCYQDAETYKVTFADDIESTVRKADRRLTLRQGGRTLVDGGDLFLPALWTAGEWFAYSRDGSRRAWPLPEEWKGTQALRAIPLTDGGRGEIFTLPVVGGKVILDLKAGEAVALSQSD